MSRTGLGRAAFHCNPVLKEVIGCIHFFIKGEEMVVEGGTKNKPKKTGEAYQIVSSSGKLDRLLHEVQDQGLGF